MNGKISISVISLLLLSNIFFYYKWASLNDSVNRTANDLLVYSVSEPLKLTIYSYLTLSENGMEEGMNLLAQYIQVLKSNIPEKNDRMSKKAQEKLRETKELIELFDSKQIIGDVPQFPIHPQKLPALATPSPPQ